MPLPELNPALEVAVESVLTQSHDGWELILVGDRSSEDIQQAALVWTAKQAERIRFHPVDPQAGTTFPSLCNQGLQAAQGELVAFLPASDIWLPSTLGEMIAVMSAQPLASLAYGSSLVFSGPSHQADRSAPASRDEVAASVVQADRLFQPPVLARLILKDSTARPALGSIVVRSATAREMGGFEAGLPASFADLAFLVKVCLQSPVFVSSQDWSRRTAQPGTKGGRMQPSLKTSAQQRYFYLWLESYLRGKGLLASGILEAARYVDPLEKTIEEQQAWIAELEMGKAWLEEQWKNWMTTAGEKEQAFQELKKWTEELEKAKEWLESDRDRWQRIARDPHPGEGLKKRLARALLGILPDAPRPPASTEEAPGSPPGEGPLQSPVSPAPLFLPGSMDPGAGSLQFPSEPVSRNWGFDRGLPVDRYYIEKFLSIHAEHVRGRVLEIGDTKYTRRYGGRRVKHSDVLDISPANPKATIVADLTDAGHIPSDTFDCIILTQTLQFICDSRAALATLQRILKPGGVLLASFPGITRLDSREYGDSWHWGFTRFSAQCLFEEVFAPSQIEVQAFGNVATACACLYGLASEELSPELLDYRDPEYDVLVTAKIIKEDSPPRRLPPLILQRKSLARKGSILLYHHVGSLPLDPWRLSVSREHFAEHLQVLQQHAHPVPLLEMTQRVEGGNLRHRSVAVTFDDGYADNLIHAAPLLEQTGVPATVFVTAGMLGQDREFWWDELERIFLFPGTLPASLSLTVEGMEYTWQLGEAAVYSESDFEQYKHWLPSLKTGYPRLVAYRQIWELLHPLSNPARQEILVQLFNWAGMSRQARPTHCTLTREQLTRLARIPGIEIGSHTASHVSLASLPEAVQREEILHSKAILEGITGSPVLSLAYPYGGRGDFSDETTGLVKDAGYRCACANYPGPVRRGADRFRLPRIYVPDCDGDAFAHLLRHWLVAR
jgi:peptidoglycan/xylan/chitin deacetylase (PgdA/CDA1 family)/SAM-dependent methyltransferase